MHNYYKWQNFIKIISVGMGAAKSNETSTPSTGALESFCEFFSCLQLEYCLREPLSKFEGLSTFYCNFINVNVLYCI